MGDFKKILGYTGCVAVVVIFGVFAAIWIGFHRGEKPEQGTTVIGGCSILFPASAGTDEQIGKVIDKWIDKYAPSSSELKGKGKLMAQSGRGNVNPAIIAAIARKESTFGTAGIANKGTHNPFGRTSIQKNKGDCEAAGNYWSSPHCYIVYKSWDEAILDEGPYLKRMYIDQSRTTITSMVTKYCPPSECDSQKYIKELTNWFNEIVRLGNGVVLGPECTTSVAIAATGKWAWPVDGKIVITSYFGVKRENGPHQGLDIDTPNYSHPPDIKAVDNGTVIEIHRNEKNMCGIYIYIDHGGGLQSLYCHLDKNDIKVTEGQTVQKGNIIAKSDNTGTSTTGPHLHLGAKLKGVFVNPLDYLPKL